MATKVESDLPPSPDSYDSDEEDIVQNQIQNVSSKNNNVASILARLQSSGSLKKLKQEFYCFRCEIEYPNWNELEEHLREHISLPSIVLQKLPSDNEYGSDNWSDDDEAEIPQQKTPQKVDISQLLKNKGLSIKKNEGSPTSAATLHKLSGLGLTIKNNTTPIKKEQPDTSNSDIMKRLDKGGIKLKLKSYVDGNNTNTFKVVNGLKDFKASDEEDEGNEEETDGEDDKFDNSAETKDDFSDDDDKPVTPSKTVQLPKGIKLIPLISNVNQHNVTVTNSNERQLKLVAAKNNDSQLVAEPMKRQGRPAVKQTPTKTKLAQNIECQANKQSEPAPESERTHSNSSAETVVVKTEVDNPDESQSSAPILSDQIKKERLSPPLPDSSSTPLDKKIKTENVQAATASPAVKTEPDVTVIEINGDSNDEDDDCCVVSTTPAPDIKPKVENIPDAPKIEEVSYPSTTSYSTQSAYSMPQAAYNATASLPSYASSEQMGKQNFTSQNWNMSESKPINILDKSTDDLFDSLISTGKRENALSDPSEYISLDKLGSQHTCEVCNTRFTDLSLLDEHKRYTGHSQSLVASTSMPSSLLPYNNSSNILSSLLPVKQIADQVGKLSTVGHSSGFTHQQNVMINIQAYPGSGGVVMPGQSPYSTYSNASNMNSNYPSSSSMYGATGQQTSSQYQSGNYNMDPNNIAYGQYPPSMSKMPYPVGVAQNTYPAQTPYSTSSPLQSMHQTVYGQTGNINQPGSMGPPASSSQPYAPMSSPGQMKSPGGSNIKIQTVQTLTPGQMSVPGLSSSSGGQMSTVNQGIGGQMPPPPPFRVTAGSSPQGPRPRMPVVRAQRPTLRAGAQQNARGTKIALRIPLKRSAYGGSAGGPGAKKPMAKYDGEGLPQIYSVHSAKDKLGSGISITKKTVNKEANAMANVLASRGIKITQKQRSRTPSPERPIPHIPNLGSGVSIKHTSKSNKLTIPEAKIGGGMSSCPVCKKMFGSHNSLEVHMTNAHPNSKVPLFKCDECSASYPRSMQLQHHKRVIHNVSGPNRELGLPVVDLSQGDTIKRLIGIGIYNYIPLTNREQGNGTFGVPVISMSNMTSGLTSSLHALGADGMLSLGPLKSLK